MSDWAGVSRLNAASTWAFPGWQSGIRDILSAWDPIGVGRGPHVADEYDCLIPKLSSLLRAHATQEEISGWLQSEVESHFGIDADPIRTDEVARSLVEWHRAAAPQEIEPGPLTLGDLRLVLARMSIEEQDSGQLPLIAAWALAGDVDSPSLRELAGESGSDARQCHDLFMVAMAELGVSAPSPSEGVRALALYWAGEMVAGVLSPYEASRLIWWRAWDAAGRPDDLTSFVGLASEWEDYPPGRAQIEKQMVEAATELLAAASTA